MRFLICDDISSPLLPFPKTEPDPHERYCAGMKKGQCSWHRGRAVGGTTNINGMFYVRGGLGVHFITYQARPLVN